MHQMPGPVETLDQLLRASVKAYAGRYAARHLKAVLVDKKAAHREGVTCQCKQWNQSILGVRGDEV